MYLVWYCFCKMRRWWKFPGPHSRLQRTPWSLRRRKGKPDLISYLDHFHSHSRWLLFFLGTVGWSLSHNGKISQPNNIFSLISIDIAVNHHPIVCSLWWLQPVFPTNFWHKYIEYSHSDNRKWTNWPFCKASAKILVNLFVQLYSDHLPRDNCTIANISTIFLQQRKTSDRRPYSFLLLYL